MVAILSVDGDSMDTGKKVRRSSVWLKVFKGPSTSSQGVKTLQTILAYSFSRGENWR